MKAIYERELKSYFYSMTGYVFIAFVTMFIGIYFMVYNMINGYPYFSYTLSSTLMILMIAVPILTMRSMSDERRSRTDQMLLTAPVSVWDIVLGKYLSMITIFAIPMASACLCPLIIKANGTAYLAEDYASILAFFLMGCVYIAIGLFISSLTESQLIAAAGTFGILLLLILWPGLLNFLPTTAYGSLVVQAVVARIVLRFPFHEIQVVEKQQRMAQVRQLLAYLAVGGFGLSCLERKAEQRFLPFAQRMVAGQQVGHDEVGDGKTDIVVVDFRPVGVDEHRLEAQAELSDRHFVVTPHFAAGGYGED